MYSIVYHDSSNRPCYTFIDFDSYDSAKETYDSLKDRVNKIDIVEHDGPFFGEDE